MCTPLNFKQYRLYGCGEKPIPPLGGCGSPPLLRFSGPAGDPRLTISAAFLIVAQSDQPSYDPPY